MNRAKLIDLISEKADLTKIAAAKALDAVLDGVTESLVKDDPVTLIGFGTFMVKERAARLGRNPATGEEIKIDKAKVISFKAGKALKEAVKEDKKSK
jgi:DNA-binding protein HU-beta